MPPIRADHGLSWRKTAGGGGDAAEERSKQPRRGTPLNKRSSPSHSRTPSPNLQAPPSANIVAVHVSSGYGHVNSRRSPSSKGAGGGSSSSRSVFPDSGPREKRRASPTHADPSRKGYTSHNHSHRGPPYKVAGASWGVSSPTPGVGGGGPGGSSSSRANSSPTRPTGSHKRDHSSPTLASRDAAVVDGLQQLLLPAAVAAAAGSAMPSSSAASTSPMLMPLSTGVSSGSAAGGGAGGSGSASSASTSRAEVREMTPLDRVFLEQPHEGRKDVEGDDLHVSNEIQRHLKTRVQSQQSQLMEATDLSSSSSAVLQQQQQQQTVSIPNVPSVVCGVGGSGGADFLDHHHGPDLLLANATGVRVTPVSPSSGSGPVQGKEDIDMTGLNQMDYLLGGSDSAGGGSGGGCCSTSNLDSSSPSRGARSRSPPVPPAVGPKPDIQIGEGGNGVGGDGKLREVVSGFDAMDLDDLDNVECALALLTAKKQWLLANNVKQQQQQHNVVPIVPPQPPTAQQSSNGTGSSRTGNGSRQRRSGGRTSTNRHGGGGEGSPSTAGGRSEAFGSTGGTSARGGGGGVSSVSSSVSYSSGRGARGQQGRPPTVPGHLSASTAAMRRSSPGSIASLAELDSYLEHHHRRLVEQVEGGVGADDVEAEIRASRQPRRGTRSHQRFGTGPGSSNSSSSIPRTVGAGVSTKSFFHSTLSADGYNSGGGNSHHDQRQQHQHQHHQQHGQRVPAEWSGNGNSNGGRSSSSSRGWDPPNLRGPGYKRERAEELLGGVEDGGWSASLRGFRGGGEGEEDADSRGSAFMGVSGTSHTSSPPPSIMSSDDVSVSSYGHPVTVLPGSPNNMRFDGRPPPSLAKIRLEAVRSPVVHHGRSGARGGRGGAEDGSIGPVFTSPDASKHVQELCSPRSAFTPRSASSLSSLASSRGRRR